MNIDGWEELILREKIDKLKKSTWYDELIEKYNELRSMEGFKDLERLVNELMKIWCKNNDVL